MRSRRGAEGGWEAEGEAKEWDGVGKWGGGEVDGENPQENPREGPQELEVVREEEVGVEDEVEGAAGVEEEVAEVEGAEEEGVREEEGVEEEGTAREVVVDRLPPACLRTFREIDEIKEIVGK